MNIHHFLVSGAIGLGVSLAAGSSLAAPAACTGLPSQADLQSALDTAVAQSNGGLGFNMWATIVANDGTVCAVARDSGTSLTSQWLGSRVISAQKANTATDFNIGKDGRKGASLYRQPICTRPCSRGAVCMGCSTATRSIRQSLTRETRACLAPRMIQWSEPASAV